MHSNNLIKVMDTIHKWEDTIHKWEATINSLGINNKAMHPKVTLHKDKEATLQVVVIHHSQAMEVDQDPHHQGLILFSGAGFR